MSFGFITELDVTPVGEIGKLWWRRTIWRLNSPLVYLSACGERHEAPIGFQNDFCSVMRWLPVAYSIWGDTAHREGVMHDLWFRKDYPNMTFMKANRLFKEASISRGKGPIDWWPMFAGVVIGGKPSFKKLPINYEFFPQYDFE